MFTFTPGSSWFGLTDHNWSFYTDIGVVVVVVGVGVVVVVVVGVGEGVVVDEGVVGTDIGVVGNKVVDVFVKFFITVEEL